MLLTAWMEYDGVIWYTMKLEPSAPLAVKRLTLRLPYADAKLCHFLCRDVENFAQTFQSVSYLLNCFVHCSILFSRLLAKIVACLRFL